MYRELGFPLAAISRLIDDPVLDRGSALRAQRDLLLEKRRRTDAVIGAVDRLLESMERGVHMSGDEIVQGFDAFANAPEPIRKHQQLYGDESRERWGDTDAYRESMRRTRNYGKADWQKIQVEGEANESRMAELLLAGASPEGTDAMDGAEAMRQHISRWFYPCDHGVHASLADMYEADARFREHYDRRAPGLAGFVAAAIRANAMRAWDAS